MQRIIEGNLNIKQVVIFIFVVNIGDDIHDIVKL